MTPSSDNHSDTLQREAEEIARGLACESCGKPWPEHLIDCKPAWLRRRTGFQGWLLRRFQRWLLNDAANVGIDFDYHEGPCCYGPGYSEASTDDR